MTTLHSPTHLDARDLAVADHRSAEAPTSTQVREAIKATYRPPFEHEASPRSHDPIIPLLIWGGAFILASATAGALRWIGSRLNSCFNKA